jgi:hypothetical protein
MELTYDLRDTGWACASISDGSRRRDLFASYISDALGDMAKAAAMLLNGSRDESFCFQDEPGEHRFVLSRGDADLLTIRVLWFERCFSGRADRFGEEVFRCQCAILDFVGQVFAILHTILMEHGLEGYKQAWGNQEFPVRAYDEIRRHLNPSIAPAGTAD